MTTTYQVIATDERTDQEQIRHFAAPAQAERWAEQQAWNGLFIVVTEQYTEGSRLWSKQWPWRDWTRGAMPHHLTALSSDF